MDNHNETKQHLATLVTQISKSEALADSAKVEDTQQDRSVINYIIHKLQAICPAWQQSLAGMGPDEKAQLLKTIKREWLNSLMAERISQQHVIDYALNKVKQSGNPFMPTIGQFIAYCHEGSTPEGTKTAFDAYKEVCEYQCLPREKRQPYGLSPEVWHTLANIQDIHSWRHMEKKKHKDYWCAEYERTLQTLRDGGPVHEAPPPRQAIENNRTPLNKQKAVSQLQQMRESLK
jgi:hypothetical protein